jgi:uncharacterized membrane protein YhhN
MPNNSPKKKNPAFFLAVLVALVVVMMMIAWTLEYRDLRRACIYIASTGYIAVALAAGAHRTWFGLLILLGVLFCWTGDIVGPKNFLAGALAFLVGHIFFIPAFIVRGVTRKGLITGFLSYAIVTAAVMAWIGPKVPPDERLVIYAYTGVIAVMGAFSVGTWQADWRIPIGAATFYISDLCLAQTAFLDGGFVFTLVGYPLYYFSVLVLAYSPVNYRPVDSAAGTVEPEAA